MRRRPPDPCPRCKGRGYLPPGGCGAALCPVCDGAGARQRQRRPPAALVAAAELAAVDALIADQFDTRHDAAELAAAAAARRAARIAENETAFAVSHGDTPPAESIAHACTTDAEGPGPVARSTCRGGLTCQGTCLRCVALGRHL